MHEELGLRETGDLLEVPHALVGRRELEPSTDHGGGAPPLPVPSAQGSAGCTGGKQLNDYLPLEVSFFQPLCPWGKRPAFGL